MSLSNWFEILPSELFDEIVRRTHPLALAFLAFSSKKYYEMFSDHIRSIPSVVRVASTEWDCPEVVSYLGSLRSLDYTSIFINALRGQINVIKWIHQTYTYQIRTPSIPHKTTLQKIENISLIPKRLFPSLLECGFGEKPAMVLAKTRGGISRLIKQLEYQAAHQTAQYSDEDGKVHVMRFVSSPEVARFLYDEVGLDFTSADVKILAKEAACNANNVFIRYLAEWYEIDFVEILESLKDIHPTYYGVEGPHFEAVKALIELGDIEVSDVNCDFAARSGLVLCKYLKSLGGIFTSEAFTWAWSRCDSKTYQWLESQGLRNTLSFEEMRDVVGLRLDLASTHYDLEFFYQRKLWIPSYLDMSNFVGKGKLELLKWCIEHSFHLLPKPKYSYDLVAQAVQCNHLAAAEFLLSHGFEINSCIFTYCSPNETLFALEKYIPLQNGRREWPWPEISACNQILTMTLKSEDRKSFIWLVKNECPFSEDRLRELLKKACPWYTRAWNRYRRKSLLF